MAGVGRTSARKSSGSHKMEDPRKKSSYASTSNTSNKYVKKTKSGGTAETNKKTVEDARASKGAFEKPKAYKGTAIKNKSGKIAGIKKDDGSYTRASGVVERKRVESSLAYDKKLKAHNDAKRTARNERFKKAEKAGTN